LVVESFSSFGDRQIFRCCHGLPKQILLCEMHFDRLHLITEANNYLDICAGLLERCKDHLYKMEASRSTWVICSCDRHLCSKSTRYRSINTICFFGSTKPLYNHTFGDHFFFFFFFFGVTLTNYDLNVYSPILNKLLQDCDYR
jgi:hypothetical protein